MSRDDEDYLGWDQSRASISHLLLQLHFEERKSIIQSFDNEDTDVQDEDDFVKVMNIRATNYAKMHMNNN